MIDSLPALDTTMAGSLGDLLQACVCVAGGPTLARVAAAGCRVWRGAHGTTCTQCNLGHRPVPKRLMPDDAAASL